jgi:hypothetical protein
MLFGEKVMKRFRVLLSVYTFLAAVVFGFAGTADAQRRNEREVRDLVRSLNAKVDDFRFGIDYQLKSSSADRQEIADLKSSLGELQAKVDSFDQNLRARRENRDDVNDIINAARYVDSFLRSNRQNQRVESDWQGVRDLIGRLAANYGVTPDWSIRGGSFPSTRPQAPDLNPDYQNNAPVSYNGAVNSDLTGTYQLDTGRSESVADAIGAANVSGSQRQDLESKLEAPSQIALLVRGDQVTLASSNATPVTFTANGGEKVENVDGRDVRFRATLRGQNLSIVSLGGQTDYTVEFV